MISKNQNLYLRHSIFWALETEIGGITNQGFITIDFVLKPNPQDKYKHLLHF